MKLFLVVATSLFLTGCFGYRSHWHTHTATASSDGKIIPPSAKNELVFTYRVEGGDAVFESEKVKLVFPDLPARKRKAFSLKGALHVQVAGAGKAETEHTCRRNFTVATLRTVYEKGTNTMTFCGREVKFVDGGRAALVGKRRVELSAEENEVTILAAR